MFGACKNGRCARVRVGEKVKPVVIAIDGPAGAGKSSIAKALARRLGFFLLDTGAIYRCVALFARQKNIDWNDGPGLATLAARLPIRFGQGQGDEDGDVFLAEQVVTTDIRSQDISLGASVVSAHEEVRRELLELQRQLSRTGPCVVEGRDIGTVVLPHAPLKFFLTASPEVRAKRRQKELEARGLTADAETILREQEERDRRDATRAVAPLKRAEDALLIDTSEQSFEEVLNQLEHIAKTRFQPSP